MRYTIEDIKFTVGLMLCLNICVTLGCCGLVNNTVNHRWRLEAIRRGAGEWTVQESGSVEFRWTLEPKK